MRLAYYPFLLKFRHPAGTSRGVLTDKPTYLLRLWDERNPEVCGYGEASVFPGLSPEADYRYEYKIVELLANIALGRPTDLSRHPSLQFGLEQAILDYSNGGKSVWFPSAFARGEQTLQINGLVWMGTAEEMTERVERKLSEGYRCVKLKIGAIDWDREHAILKGLRSRFDAGRLEIRVDANGGFSREEAPERLRQLADLQIHSIEQPVKAGDHEAMARICRESPVAVALDEELIGLYDTDSRRRMLDTIRPAFIILKPTLCGGFSGAREWIALARERGIGWWVTSCLESNVGLTALAQWTATLGNPMPSGLGTGQLYTNNIPSPLRLQGDRLSCELPCSAMREALATLDFRC